MNADYGTLAGEPLANQSPAKRGPTARPRGQNETRRCPSGHDAQGIRRVSTMRFTVVDHEGAISFVGPPHALKVFAAACSRRPADHRALIDLAGDYDADLAFEVRRGLIVFDATSTTGLLTAAANAGDGSTDQARPFRVVDEPSRRRSLEPARAGLIVFNLNARRIVQVQNSYADLERRGRGRVRRNGKPTRALYHYELPPDWTIVP